MKLLLILSLLIPCLLGVTQGDANKEDVIKEDPEIEKGKASHGKFYTDANQKLRDAAIAMSKIAFWSVLIPQILVALPRNKQLFPDKLVRLFQDALDAGEEMAEPENAEEMAEPENAEETADPLQTIEEPNPMHRSSYTNYNTKFGEPLPSGYMKPKRFFKKTQSVGRMGKYAVESDTDQSHQFRRLAAEETKPNHNDGRFFHNVQTPVPAGNAVTDEIHHLVIEADTAVSSDQGSVRRNTRPGNAQRETTFADFPFLDGSQSNDEPTVLRTTASAIDDQLFQIDNSTEATISSAAIKDRKNRMKSEEWTDIEGAKDKKKRAVENFNEQTTEDKPFKFHATLNHKLSNRFDPIGIAFNQLNIEDEDCRKRVLCELDKVAQNNQMLSYLLRLVRQSVLQYQSSNADSPSVDCKELFGDCSEEYGKAALILG